MLGIITGMMGLVLFMGVVMGTPFAYYLRRDREYEAAKDQPQSTRLRTWYE